MADILSISSGQKFRWRGRVYVMDHVMSSNAPKGNAKKGSFTVKAWPASDGSSWNSTSGPATTVKVTEDTDVGV
jgi:hypothetical protein